MYKYKMGKKKDRGLNTTLGLAGASIGMGIVGGGLGSSALQQAGSTTAQFVPVTANIHGAGMTMDMLKELKKK